MDKKDKIDLISIKGKKYNIVNNCRCFIEPGKRESSSTGRGMLAYIQRKLKKTGPLYYRLLTILGPVRASHSYKKRLSQLLERYNGASTIILNIGSGPQHLQGKRDIINVDLFPFDEVDIVADASDLPIKNNSVDFIINVAMLEHTPVPETIVDEIERILKPGGAIFAYLPFIVPYHAAPNDFHRWTKNGAAELFAKFDSTLSTVGCGPTSGLLYVLQSWLAMFLSLGNKTIYDALFLVFLITLFPVKYLDIILERFSFSEIIASGFVVTATKKRTSNRTHPDRKTR